MHGLERFESGWKNNQNYFTSLVDDNFDYGGFGWFQIGSLNTQTNAFASSTGPSGLKLAAVVTVTLGVSASPILIKITYHNQSGIATTLACDFPQGSSVGTCQVPTLPVSDSIASVTIASATPTTSGTIQFWAPTNLAETFNNVTWGPPDPGL